MSISGAKVIERPFDKYISFKNGGFEYYDKDKGESVKIPLPIRFVKLDELSCITGFHESSSSGIFSNEVHNTKEEVLSVRSYKGGDIADGLYLSIKDKVKAQGGRYTKSLYALLNGELVNIQLCGAAFSSWVDTDRKNKNTFVVSELKDGKKGATVYKIPIFVPVEDNPQEIEKAVSLDKELQEYFQERKNARKEHSQEEAHIINRNDIEEVFSEDQSKFDVPQIQYQSDVKPEDLPF